MALVAITFPGDSNLSDAVALSGETDIVTNGITGSDYVEIRRECPDGVYRVMPHAGNTAKLDSSRFMVRFNGLGNYKFYRSNTAQAVSYEA